jgi:hypothetical protein
MTPRTGREVPLVIETGKNGKFSRIFMTPYLPSSRAWSRDLFPARKSEAEEKRSLHAALQAFFETTTL